MVSNVTFCAAAMISSRVTLLIPPQPVPEFAYRHKNLGDIPAFGTAQINRLWYDSCYIRSILPIEVSSSVKLPCFISSS